MSWMDLKFRPGIYKDGTRYSSMGTWYDCNLVRFRNGLPEKWDGWVNGFTGFTYEGQARSFHTHTTNGGLQYHSIGTNKYFYMLYSDVSYEVTPLKTTTTLGTDPFAAVDTSTTVTVTHTAHGMLPGDYVLYEGATTFAGIPAGDINILHEVISYIDPNTYTIEVATAATSTASGGGSATDASPIYHAGAESYSPGFGWGFGGYGTGTWGGSLSSGVMGQWTQFNWGEDLVACPRGGPIFYWDATNPGNRMVDILDLASADGNAPSVAQFIVVSLRDRHLIAFGAEAFGGSASSPMLVRWCSQEDILDWDEASTTGTAGSLQLSYGSRLISAKPTNREILVWSDAALYSLQYIGAPFIFGVEVISQTSDIAGLNANTVANDTVFWIGNTGFYSFSARPQKLECPIWDYISKDVDWDQSEKIYASTIDDHNEIIFFYQSIASTECDKYVTFNYVENAWAYGSLARTCWHQSNDTKYAYGLYGGSVYTHGFGENDGSTDPETALNAYIESGPIELSAEGAYSKGDRFMFVRRILHDFEFRKYSSDVVEPNESSVNVTLKMADKPGEGFSNSTSSSQVDQSVTMPVTEFTEESHVRLRGRSLTLRVESNSTDTNWRMGVPRIDVRTDGKR